MKEDEWLRNAWEEIFIKEDEDPKVYREKTLKSQMEEWQSKPMHGQFLRQIKDLSSNDTWQWLQRGELKKRDRKDDNGCTRPSTKNKIYSKSH